MQGLEGGQNERSSKSRGGRGRSLLVRYDTCGNFEDNEDRGKVQSCKGEL